MEFADQWLWLILMIFGLLLALMELLIGVETGLDLVFLGSGLIVAGLITWPFHAWPLTIIVAGAVCAGYIVIGRRYVHRWTAVKANRTNVDAMIGRHGVVLRSIVRNTPGLVKVGGEEWRATASEDIREGNEIEVLEVKGVTLTVKKATGGS